MARPLTTMLGTLGAMTLLASLGTSTAFAGLLGAPQGLRAAAGDVVLIEEVNGRPGRLRHYGCTGGSRYGSIIIEPARAPRSYYVDYAEYASRYGWGWWGGYYGYAASPCGGCPCGW